MYIDSMLNPTIVSSVDEGTARQIPLWSAHRVRIMTALGAPDGVPRGYAEIGEAMRRPVTRGDSGK